MQKKVIHIPEEGEGIFEIAKMETGDYFPDVITLLLMFWFMGYMKMERKLKSFPINLFNIEIGKSDKQGEIIEGVCIKKDKNRLYAIVIRPVLPSTSEEYWFPNYEQAREYLIEYLKENFSTVGENIKTEDIEKVIPETEPKSEGDFFWFLDFLSDLGFYDDPEFYNMEDWQCGGKSNS